MFRQTSAKQTNAQTQARQPNKQAVEGAGRHPIADLYAIHESRENLI